MIVLWTDRAKENLQSIEEFVRQSSEQNATELVGRIVSRSEMLGAIPRMGSMLEGRESDTLREVIEGPFRIIYRIRRDGIYIMGVVHGARHLPRNL